MICENCKYYEGKNRICRNMKARYVGCDECHNANPKPTNADRIRAMTDEELAERLSNISACCEYDECPAKDVGNDPLGFVKCSSDANSCQEAWLNWLKQEAEE